MTQLSALAGVLVGLQKYGFDIRGALRGALGLEKETKEIDADNRNAMQPLMLKMDELAQYANHDTTALLTEIRDSLRENFLAIRQKHDEWDRRGIPTADCKNK